MINGLNIGVDNGLDGLVFRGGQWIVWTDFGVDDHWDQGIVMEYSG